MKINKVKNSADFIQMLLLTEISENLGCIGGLVAEPGRFRRG